MNDMENIDGLCTPTDSIDIPERFELDKKLTHMSLTASDPCVLKADEILKNIDAILHRISLLSTKVSDFTRYDELVIEHITTTENKLTEFQRQFESLLKKIDFEKQFEKFLERLEERQTELLTHKLEEMEERHLYRARSFNTNEKQKQQEDFIRYLQKRMCSLQEDNRNYIEKIAVMEEQLRIHTEDFQAERSDREHAVKRWSDLQHEVRNLGNELDKYRNKNMRHHRCCRDREGMIEQCD